jgi:DNA repair/transcription protein MET18/MMS19
VVAKTIPHLLALFQNPDEVANRDSVVSHLADLSEALRKSPLEVSGEGNLTSLKDETLSVFVVGLKPFLSRRSALRGLKSLVETHGLITDEELGFVVHSVNEVILDEEDDDEIRWEVQDFRVMGRQLISTKRLSGRAAHDNFRRVRSTRY